MRRIIKIINYQCPIPNAQSPMPNPQCPMPKLIKHQSCQFQIRKLSKLLP
ncbi:MAG: hypothetical protein AAF630_19195 [Cyanobacteria bacterium P01_C01_bin.38]